jgi:hypothetical protein
LIGPSAFENAFLSLRPAAAAAFFQAFALAPSAATIAALADVSAGPVSAPRSFLPAAT